MLHSSSATFKFIFSEPRRRFLHSTRDFSVSCHEASKIFLDHRKLLRKVIVGGKKKELEFRRDLRLPSFVAGENVQFAHHFKHSTQYLVFLFTCSYQVHLEKQKKNATLYYRSKLWIRVQPRDLIVFDGFFFVDSGDF